MTEVRANGLGIYYETVGDPADPPLLLIMGLGAQLIDWPAGFVEQLAGRGFHVILFDNRDAGLSTALDDLGLPDIPAIIGGDPSSVAYLLSDLAADAADLLKALGIDRAHVVGASMGGMIAQQLVIDRPDVVASLASIMSTTGARGVGRPTPAAQAVLLRPPAADRAEAIANGIETARVIGSPAYPAPRADIERRVGAKYDRGYRPAGTLRQYAAIIASPDRTEGLRDVAVPAVVIHGEADPLVPMSGGLATAEAIPGAELVLIPGMGHDLPVQLWTQVVDAIAANAARR
ncbi:alpha/beta fold hydrolase [Actinoplanes sp. KI2]|nr:alpha/beta hydrolase [Actinoplanes sp. KI2]MCU7726109.1 alpha/beta fold hydrolase [Actinoplanes sp. KI2]